MQKLAEICIRRPVFASMLILALVVVGAASYFKLAVDRFPAIDVPTLRVSTTLPGASPVEVETQLSDQIERAVNTVEVDRAHRPLTGPVGEPLPRLVHVPPSKRWVVEPVLTNK